MDQLNISTHCNICGKLYVYIGDVPSGGWPVGQEPFCTGHEQKIYGPGNQIPSLGGFKMPEQPKDWKYCPHCGHELR